MLPVILPGRGPRPNSRRLAAAQRTATARAAMRLHPGTVRVKVDMAPTKAFTAAGKAQDFARADRRSHNILGEHP